MEIPIKDPDRALSFYRGVFGWDCNEEGQDSPADPGVLKRYFFSSKTKSTNGCFIQVEPKNLLAPSLAPNNETKERWAVINSFAVENIDNTLDNIERIGGRVYWYEVIPQNRARCLDRARYLGS